MNIKQEKNRLELKAEQMAINGYIKKPIDLWIIYKKIAESKSESDIKEVEKILSEGGTK